MNQLFIPTLDRRVVLSGLWVIVMINMLKADILGLYMPGAVEAVAAFAGDTPVSTLMLGAAIIMEVSIVMIMASIVLVQRVSRWANIAVAVLTIAFIWGGASAHPHYIFIATVETVCLLLIIGMAWRWSEHQS